MTGLLHRPRTDRAGHSRPSPPPRRPVQLREPGNLAGTRHRTTRRGPPLRHRAHPSLERPASQARRTRTMDPPRRPSDRCRNRHPRRRRTPTQTHRAHQKDAVAVGYRRGPITSTPGRACARRARQPDRPRRAPDWPSGDQDDVYRVDIEGTPSIFQETAFRFIDGSGRDAATAGCLATGLRALNAVPAVDDLSPGWVTPLDLPLIPGRGDHSLK